jgi:hypothetical protein
MAVARWRVWLDRMLGSSKTGNKRPSSPKRNPRPFLWLEQLEERFPPAVLTVNSLADTTAAGTVLTLREAVLVVDGTLGRSLTSQEQAQVSGTLGNNDTIQFNLPIGPQTIALSGGFLGITQPVSIVGSNAGNLSINGNSLDRVFVIGLPGSPNLNLNVSLNSLTISGGNSVNDANNFGGGLANFGTLTVSNTTFSGNTAGASGGAGIFSDGALTVNNSTFSGNTTGNGGSGGGIDSISPGTLTLTNCTFDGNNAASHGGGLASSGSATLTNCTITNNRVTATSSSPLGGGIQESTPAKLFNTIVAGNFQGGSSSTTDDDLAGAADATSAFNFIGIGGSGGLVNAVNNNQVGVVNRMLGVLANNGGPTQTVALLPGCSAINSGSNAYVTSGETDQRGLARTVNGAVDIGAFELQITSTAPSNQSANQGVAASFSLGSFSDVNSAAGPWSVDVNWSDSSPDTTFTSASQGTLPAQSHTFQNPGTAVVTVTVTDANHDTAQATFQIVIAGSANTTGVPTPAHVVIVIDENQDFDDIIGNPTQAPYLNSLAQGGADFVDSFAVAHPSQPNYLALFSGSTQGVTDDGTHSFSSTNLATSLIAKGLTFGGYFDELPSTGYTGGQVGYYVPWHNPLVSFTNVPSSLDMPFTSFPTNFNQLPTVSIVVPDEADDMTEDDGTVAQGDAWLQANLGAFATWAQTHNSLLITTFDEDDDDDTSNQIATILYGQMVQPGTVTQSINHYNVWRTIEDMYGLSDSGAASAPITGVWNNVAAPGSAVLTVNSLADTTAAGSALTLREAVELVDGTLGRALTPGEQAQITGTLGNNNTIEFNLPAGPQTISLSGGALDITQPVSIIGPGSGNLTITDNSIDRDFIIGTDFSQNLSLDVAISGLTIAGGSALGTETYGGGLLNFGTLTISNTTFSGDTAGSSGGGGIYNDGMLTLSNCTFTNDSVTNSGPGGGIQNAGSATLTVANCTFTGNTAVNSASGACIANSGVATVNSSTFTNNTAASNAGGIYNGEEGVLTVNNCSFSNNTAGSDGAAIDQDGTATVTGTTMSGNTTGSEGGAMDNKGTLLGMINCTLYGNTAQTDGGGLKTSGPALIENCTITANTATAVSGGGGGIDDQTVEAKLFNTIVVGNFVGTTPSATANDIIGTVDPTSAFNLIGIGGSGALSNGVNGNQVGVTNSGLGALANNGGLSMTVNLLAGSPAIDKGGNAYVTASETDERGLARIVNGTVDIGALEVQVTATPPSSQYASPGTAALLNLGSFADAAAAASPWTVVVSWGDNTAATTFATNTQGSLGIQSHTYQATGTVTVTVAVTDANNDTATEAYPVFVSSAATHFFVSAPSSVQAGQFVIFTVTAEDHFNNTATGYSGTVQFTGGGNQAQFSNPSPLINGVGTFVAALKTAGTQTIQAADTSLGTLAGTSNPIVVNPAALNQFAVSAPLNATAGTPFVFTVAAQDKYGNTVTAYGGTVHFTSNDGRAVLPANSILIAGAGIFSATLGTAGSQTLSAADTVSSSLTGSIAMSINAAGATHFVVNAVGSATAGIGFPFTVTAEDRFNNIAAGYSGTVRFSSGGTQAGLPLPAVLTSGTGMFVATLMTAGSQPISAADMTVTTISGTSNAVAVSAAAAARFVITTALPVYTGVTAGPNSFATTGLPTSFSVRAVDMFGNTASTYAGSVQFASSDSVAILPASATLVGGNGNFSVTLMTAGNQTLTASDPVSGIGGMSNPFVTGGLVVTGFASTPSGFSISFNRAFNPGTLLMYTTGTTPDDVILATSGSQVSVRGSVLIDPTDTRLTFVKTDSISSAGTFNPANGLLAAGSYTLTLRSLTAGNGFEDALGAGLDGNNSGGNANFKLTFSVSTPPVAVGIPDFARGPSNTDALFLPSTMSNGSTFSLSYTNPAASPATGTATITFSTIAATLQSNIQNALSIGSLATQVGVNKSANNTPNSVVIVTNDTTSGANVLITFQCALAQATNQLLASSTAGVSIALATINVANNIPGDGIPIALSNGMGVTSGSFTLQYNPSLLTISGAVSKVAGASFVLVSNNTATGTAVLSLSSPTALGSGSISMGSLLATVPLTAGANYGAEQLLHFSSVQLNGTAGAIAATNADGVQVAAYFGDVTDMGGPLSLADATAVFSVANAIANTTAQTIPGFAAFPNLDPAIIGDVSLQGSVTSTDAGAMTQEVGGTVRVTIPYAPIGQVNPPLSVNSSLAPVSYLASTSAVSLPPVSQAADNRPSESPLLARWVTSDALANLEQTARSELLTPVEDLLFREDCWLERPEPAILVRVFIRQR